MDEGGEEYEEEGEGSAKYVVAAVLAASKRKKATTTGWDYNYVVNKQGKDVILSKISKATGEVTGEVSFGRDRQPRYTVDLVTHLVYYHKGRATLMSYLVE
ncbi:MAG: hypothetical protein AAFP77_28410 [Bacteroidota bacterium]